MGSYCRHCGNYIQDGAVCHCLKAVSERAGNLQSTPGGQMPPPVNDRFADKNAGGQYDLKGYVHFPGQENAGAQTGAQGTAPTGAQVSAPTGAQGTAPTGAQGYVPNNISQGQPYQQPAQPVYPQDQYGQAYQQPYQPYQQPYQQPYPPQQYAYPPQYPPQDNGEDYEEDYDEPEESPAVSTQGKTIALLVSIIGVLFAAMIVVFATFGMKAVKGDKKGDAGSSSESGTTSRKTTTTAPEDKGGDETKPETKGSEPAETTTTTTSATTTTTTTTTRKTTTTTTKPQKSADMKIPDKLYNGIEEGDLYYLAWGELDFFYGPDADKYETTGLVLGQIDYLADYSEYLVQEHGRTKDGSWLYVSFYGTDKYGWIMNTTDLVEMVENPGISGQTYFLDDYKYGHMNTGTKLLNGPNDIRDAVKDGDGNEIYAPAGEEVFVVGEGPGYYYVTFQTIPYYGWIPQSSVDIEF
ncbi:MAG: hypothetical protein IJ737_07825 [Ruminococcus sp.]|nr:hypothetical protein [Ruminococcus sp.]